MARAVLATAAALLVVPATGASAASLALDSPCYVEGSTVRVTGSGFTPNYAVHLSFLNGGFAAPAGAAPTDSGGAFAGSVQAPQLDPGVGQINYPLAASETQRDASGADQEQFLAGVRVTTSAFTVRTASSFSPSRRIPLEARGFIGGGTLYAHVRRGRRRIRDVRLGTLQPPCGKLLTRTRLFRRKTRRGPYTVQFDRSRRYSRTAFPRVRRTYDLF
jgi:hypothetical protein